MFRSLEMTYEEKAKLNKIAQLPAHRKFKYGAIGCGISVIILLIIMIFGLDSFSETALLVLRGCVGLFAILFMIFVGYYLYQVYYSYYKHYKQKECAKAYKTYQLLSSVGSVR